MKLIFIHDSIYHLDTLTSIMLLFQCILFIGLLLIFTTHGCLSARSAFDPSRTVTVKTPVGEIVGKVETIKFDGDSYDVTEFLGIPYAEPPVGANRFKKSLPRAPFTAAFSAFDYGATCLQPPGEDLTHKVTIEEDCLFLNIFVPGNGSTIASKLPVMVWIHGGGFMYGTSTAYPGDNLSAYGQVIVVTINYRLAHIGFLRTKEAFANFGLWDQHLAIKWVHDNIKAFGGDEDKITIFGESAGSSSVVYQALFPGNKNLFQRAIAESGGITSSWAYSTEQHADQIFKNFTAEIGCISGSNDGILDCLRNKTTGEVADVMLHHKLITNNVVPSKDSDFVPMHPQYMVNRSSATPESLDVFSNIDFMMGSCSIDGALFLKFFGSLVNISDLEHFKVSRSEFETSFVPGTLKYIFTNIAAIKIWLDVRYSTFNIQILNVEYRISNSISHSNRMSNIEYQTKSNIQIECRISNIKLNPTFKSNVEYRISNSIQHSNRMLNIEYQTKSNIQIECRISNIKLNLTFKF